MLEEGQKGWKTGPGTKQILFHFRDEEIRNIQ